MTKKEADLVYVAAQRMSNWLYNMSQSPILLAHERLMKDMVNDWDNTKTPLALMTATRSRKRKE